MVVTVEDDVKTMNSLGNGESGVLVVFISLYAAFESRVEKSDDKVWLLLLLYKLNPFAGA